MMNYQGLNLGYSQLSPPPQDSVLLELIRTINRLDFSINRLTLALETHNMASNPPGHQVPGSKEVELPNDDGYAAKLPKR